MQICVREKDKRAREGQLASRPGTDSTMVLDVEGEMYLNDNHTMWRRLGDGTRGDGCIHPRASYEPGQGGGATCAPASVLRVCHCSNTLHTNVFPNGYYSVQQPIVAVRSELVWPVYALRVSMSTKVGAHEVARIIALSLT